MILPELQRYGGLTNLQLPGRSLSLRLDVFRSTSTAAKYFVESEQPLGFLSSAVTCLAFEKVDMEGWDHYGQVFKGSSFRAAQRWTFFCAISKLSSLKRLCLPKAAWEDLTAYSAVDSTAPLVKLPGLVVQDACSTFVFAEVCDGRLQTTQ